MRSSLRCGHSIFTHIFSMLWSTALLKSSSFVMLNNFSYQKIPSETYLPLSSSMCPSCYPLSNETQLNPLSIGKSEGSWWPRADLAFRSREHSALSPMLLAPVCLNEFMLSISLCWAPQWKSCLSGWYETQEDDKFAHLWLWRMETTSHSKPEASVTCVQISPQSPLLSHTLIPT